jgi:hypothetical protein
MSSDANARMLRYIALGIVGTSMVGGFIALSVVLGEDFVIPAFITLGVVGVVVGKGPVGQALARRIEQGPAPATLGEDARFELDELRSRVAELEERLDFAERMLVSPRESERVGGA